MNGMRDRERLILELNRFMGHARPFLDKPIFKLHRAVFTLKDHQRQAVAELEEARKNGRKIFLIVLHTGTGKTEIFIEDPVRVKRGKKI
jgi:superfamily II DNA or RNA helicase